MKSGERLELDLTDLSYLGDGVGHVDAGFAVFVRGGLPGERALVEIDECRPRYARGHLVELLRAAPPRVEPRCPYFGACGGCQVQHLAYAEQLRWKTANLRAQLQRIGRLPDPPVLPIIPAAHPWHYRNQARFQVDTAGHLGFSRAHSRRLVLIEHCSIMQPEIVALMPRLQQLLPGAHQIVVRYGARTGQFLIAPPLPLPESELPSGQPAYEEILLGRRFRVSASSFFQVNTRVDERTVTPELRRAWPPLAERATADLSQAEVLALLVLDRLPLTGRELVVDAYCGVGTFTLLAAERASEVIGIEEARCAVRDAEYNARGVANVRFVEGRTEDRLASLDRSAARRVKVPTPQ